MACVKDLIILESFQQLTLAAGNNGLYRSVSWPNIAQTIDIREWLVGGDVILMTGIGLRCTPYFLNSILEQAIAGDAACLILLLSENHIPAVPSETLEYADRLGFPLFTAPWEVQISNIIRDISFLLTMERYQEEAMNDLLEELLFSEGRSFSAAVKALVRKRSLTGPHVVLAVEYPELPSPGQPSNHEILVRQHIINLIIREIRTIFPRMLYLQQKQRLFFLLRQSPQIEVLPQVCTSLHQEAQHHWPGADLHFGIGLPYSSPQQFHHSTQEALKAANLCSPSQPVMRFADLGIYQLLLDLPDQMRVHQFAADRLKPILEYDTKYQKNLLHTLEVYLQTNCSAVRTAERLYIHRNTLAYQLSKIRELLGSEIEDAETRNLLFNCLKIHAYCKP